MTAMLLSAVSPKLVPTPSALCDSSLCEPPHKWELMVCRSQNNLYHLAWWTVQVFTRNPFFNGRLSTECSICFSLENNIYFSYYSWIAQCKSAALEAWDEKWKVKLCIKVPFRYFCIERQIPLHAKKLGLNLPTRDQLCHFLNFVRR